MLELVRRRRLSGEYSLLWVICTVVVAVLGFSTPMRMWLSNLLGMAGAAFTVFAAGLAFVIGMLLYLSVKMSRLGLENHLLTRELAPLRFELERVRAGGAGGTGA